jgi:hypothetical protein
MASRHASDLFLRATVSVFVAGIACLACQSDADDDAGDEGARAGVDSASVIEVRPRDDDPSPSSGAGGVADLGEAAEGSEPAVPTESSPASSAGTADGSNDDAPTLEFEACTSNGGVYGDNCDTIYVAVKQASPPRCVQFNIDNCGVYGRQGLGADVPLSWRLASASIGSNLDQCEVGVFYADSARVADASGTITWNETTRLPTELAMELTLVPSASAEDTSNVEISTSEPLNPVACIEE